jgi:steroid delta-isomerase-like uncharacterized protein
VKKGIDIWEEFATLLQKMDYDGFASLFSSDAVYVEPAGRHEGREAIRAWIASGADSLSDIHFDTARVIDHGGTVVAEWTWRATQTGPLPMPDGSVLPATGKTMEFPGVTIAELRDGQIVAARDYLDQLAMLMQLGLLPGG